MHYGLGIDTGGTYTDAVIYNFDDKSVVAAAKALTTNDDLSEGIINSIGNLVLIDGDVNAILSKIELVSLSTTLATNACVEDKGGRAVLIVIGGEEEKKVISLYGKDYGLTDIENIVVLDGGCDVRGKIVKRPDFTELDGIVERYHDKADAFAVVCIWGSRNSTLETEVREYIYGITQLPVVCGHELSAKLNFLKRASCAYVNARLLPIIDAFLTSIKISMKQFGITAPVVAVKGDGSLMSEEYARLHPVETLLCGPAASVSGGMKLSGEKDCVVVDMGGTTSDIAIVKNGSVIISEDGATVGGFRTGILSVMIETAALGGDSLISFDVNGKAVINRRKVLPLCRLALKYPQIIDSLKLTVAARRRHSIALYQFFYVTAAENNLADCNEDEIAVINALKETALAVTDLCEKTELSLYIIDKTVERLERRGIIMRSSLTPTDIMHIKGDFSVFNAEAARLGAAVMSVQTNKSVEAICDDVYDKMKRRIYKKIVQTLCEYEYPDSFGEFDKLLDAAFDGGCDMLRCAFSTNAVLTGIGAPIHIFLPEVAEKLNTKAVIPEYAPVANAYGAITSSIVASAAVTVIPEYAPVGIEGYICYSKNAPMRFAELNEAINYAREKASSKAVMSAVLQGAKNPSVEVIETVKTNEAPVGFSVPDGTVVDFKEEQLSALLEITYEAKATDSIIN